MQKLLKNPIILIVILTMILFICIIGYKVTINCVNSVVKEKEGLLNAEELKMSLKCIADKAMSGGKKL